MKNKKGEGKSKYLPPFDREKAEKLLHILEPLMKGSYSLMGVVDSLKDLLQRPSYFRKCDVLLSKEIFEAIKRVQ